MYVQAFMCLFDVTDEFRLQHYETYKMFDIVFVIYLPSIYESIVCLICYVYIWRNVFVTYVYSTMYWFAFFWFLLPL